jgi:hypothetical protein
MRFITNSIVAASLLLLSVQAEAGTSTTGEKTSFTAETPFDKGKLEL